MRPIQCASEGGVRGNVCVYLHILERNKSACLFVCVLYCFLSNAAQRLQESTGCTRSVTAVPIRTMFSFRF